MVELNINTALEPRRVEENASLSAAIRACTIPYSINVNPVGTMMRGDTIVDIVFEIKGNALFTIQCTRRQMEGIIETMIKSPDLKSPDLKSPGNPQYDFRTLIFRGCVQNDGDFTPMVTQYGFVRIRADYDIISLNEYLHKDESARETWGKESDEGVIGIISEITNKLLDLIGTVSRLRSMGIPQSTDAINFVIAHGRTFEVRKWHADAGSSYSAEGYGAISVRIVDPIHNADLIHIIPEDNRYTSMWVSVSQCLEKSPKLIHGQLYWPSRPRTGNRVNTLTGNKTDMHTELIRYSTYQNKDKDDVQIAMPTTDTDDVSLGILLNIFDAIGIPVEISTPTSSSALRSPPRHSRPSKSSARSVSLYLPYILLGVGAIGLMLAIRKAAPYKQLAGWLALVVLSALRIYSVTSTK